MKYNHSDLIKLDVFNKQIGGFIKNKRNKLGITGKDFGVMLNVSQQQISRYENGITKITVTLLNDMLIILGTSWDEFLSFNGLSDK
ncbi:hypothetical protein MASR2M36_11040 [Providencia sp.]